MDIEDRIHGLGMAEQRLGAGLAQRRFQVFHRLLFRRFQFQPPRAVRARDGVGRRPQAVEHVAHFLRHDLLDNFGNALAEGDAAPLGIALDRIALLVIQSHVLRPVARQGAGEPVPIGKIVAAIMQLHAVAVS